MIIDNNEVLAFAWRVLSMPIFYPFYALVFITLLVRAVLGRRRRG